MSNIRRLVECFESERYYPFGGWSKTLLAHDRDAFGCRDAEWGCATLAEFSSALLSPGWFYEQAEWQGAKNDPNVDAEGWSYCVDFSGFNEPASEALGKLGNRRGSVIFLSDPRMSADEQELLLAMEGQNFAVAGAGQQAAAAGGAAAVGWKVFGGTDDADIDASGAGGYQAPGTLTASTAGLGSAAAQTNDATETKTGAQEGKVPGPAPQEANERRQELARLSAAVRDPAYDATGIGYETRGSATKSMHHFARRRRLLRWQCFDVSLATGGVKLARLPCDHCDLSQVDDIAAVLLNALASASTVAHPRAFNEQKCNVLKTRLVGALKLSCVSVLEEYEASGLASTSATEATEATEATAGVEAPPSPPSAGAASASAGGAPPKPPRADSPRAGTLLDLVNGLLLPFKESCASVGSSFSNLLASGTSSELLGRRTADVSHAFFSYAERRQLAVAIIKRHDVPVPGSTARAGAGYRFHCSQLQCGPSCQFAHETCPNAGCETEYSVMHRQRHKDECQWQEVTCTRGCGEQGIVRRGLPAHLEHVCPLRPAPCPFAEVGCMPVGLVAGAVEKHVQECHAAHSMLMMRRIAEQQGVIKMLHRQAVEMRAETKMLNAGLTTATASLAVLEARQGVDERHAIDKVNKRVDKLSGLESTMQDRLNEVSAQLTRNADAERNRVNLEFGKVAKAIAALK